MATDIVWQPYEAREARWLRQGQRPVIAWLTGLSGAGKTSIANAVDRVLARQGRQVFVLDGDNLRHGLCRDLGFSEADRSENVRRAAEVAHLMAQTGLVTIVALISPLRTDRAQARAIAANLPFIEVFIDTPVAVCAERDPKGLYARARTGAVTLFTGVTAPYEAPENPDLVLLTEGRTIDVSAAPLCDKLLKLSTSLV